MCDAIEKSRCRAGHEMLINKVDTIIFYCFDCSKSRLIDYFTDGDAVHSPGLSQEKIYVVCMEQNSFFAVSGNIAVFSRNSINGDVYTTCCFKTENSYGMR